jgi:branched-chain amino acid aminotransferase
VRYLPDEQRTGGPVYLKLLAQLKAIQRGKIQDEFGWRFKVRSEDQEVD